MTRSRKLVAFAAGLAALMPVAALAQSEPPEADVPDEVYEAQTGTRIQHDRRDRRDQGSRARPSGPSSPPTAASPSCPSSMRTAMPAPGRLASRASDRRSGCPGGP